MTLTAAAADSGGCLSSDTSAPTRRTMESSLIAKQRRADAESATTMPELPAGDAAVSCGRRDAGMTGPRTGRRQSPPP
jgi:hypothetical protein